MTSITFHIHNRDVKNPDRQCTSLLSPDEENRFVSEGFVIPAQRAPSAAVTALGEVVNALAATRFSSAAEKTYQDEFPGQYIRDPHKADPQIITTLLLDYPLADTARSLLGPRIVLRNSNIRITHARSGDSTIWHTPTTGPTSHPPPGSGTSPPSSPRSSTSTQPTPRPGRCTSCRAATTHPRSRQPPCPP